MSIWMTSSLRPPCQNFEEVPQTIVVTKVAFAVPKITRPPLKMASLKDARVVIEEGGCTIWGQLTHIPYKYDKFDLGFTSGAQKAIRRACVRGPPKLNRGSCCTAKFSLSFLKIFSKKIFSDSRLRKCRLGQTISSTLMPQIRV